MKKRLPLLLALGVVSFASSPMSATEVATIDARTTRNASKQGEIIVKFKASTDISINEKTSNSFRLPAKDNEINTVLQEIGVKEIQSLMPLTGGITYNSNLKGYNGKPVEARPMQNLFVINYDLNNLRVEEVVSRLQSLPEVEYAEPNYLVYSLEERVPDDTYYSLQYGLSDINLPKLWAVEVINKEGPVIAILDTGVDITHPDLIDNIWTNPSEANGAKGYDDDNNGYKDDIHGWDFINQTGNIIDYNGHGTHCAGIAAACGFNGIGIVGANPDARIMPLTVMQSNGQGDIATIIKAIDYAIANGADMLSMSLGTYSSSQAFEDALGRAYQKTVIVAAAGNDGFCLNHAHVERGQFLPMPMFPAAYTFVLGVQASSETGEMASFSNYDDNGPMFSEYGGNKLYNYELKVPGVSITSTYPGGGYKALNGTSMATPLVAGAISRLLQTKEYINREELFGDLINCTTEKGNLDIYAAYLISDLDRVPSIQFVNIDMVDADEDGRADAGETVEFYPVILNEWGNANNISLKLESAETVNNTFEILEGESEFGLNLSSYGKGRSLNPLKIKFNDDVADGRIVRIKFTASGPTVNKIEQILEVKVENAVELTGILKEDMTLYPNQHYVITGTFGIPEGIQLTIKPGCIIKFRDKASLIVEGNLDCNGEPGNMITFTKGDHDSGNITAIEFGNNNISYCKFENFEIPHSDFEINASNCLFRYFDCYTFSNKNNSFNLCTFEKVKAEEFLSTRLMRDVTIKNSNIINCAYLYSNTNANSGFLVKKENGIRNSNVFSNKLYRNGFQEILFEDFSINVCGNMGVLNHEEPPYLGTSSLEIAKERVIDINNTANDYFKTLTEYDFSNMPDKPYAEAPGIVWKVVVNDKYDAQDDFDIMPALGVGTHKFEVYFNRPMNKNVAPTIAMGVRPPYNSVGIGERGSWNEKGDIYTAYLTISGKSTYDGLNRIYVAEAEDTNYFPIPLEDSRFNVLVQAAGSLSDGFMAEAGLGRVKLTWEDSEENFDDMMGYNMYRYEIDSNGLASDTIRINKQLIEPKITELTDYEVSPKKTYCYYYKVMRTDLAENSPSKTVAVTPLTATAGDADGSGSVDVTDVITTVNYAVGLDPKPFIFEAADMNSDNEIDILDVVCIINEILHPGSYSSLSVEALATCYVDENGMLYIDSPVALSGVQLNLKLDKNSEFKVCDSLNGFEQTGSWLDEEYLFMAYNLNGKTLAAGVNPIAIVNAEQIKDIVLSDAGGRRIMTLFEGSHSGINELEINSVSKFQKGIYNMNGLKISDDIEIFETLPSGIYIVNGEKIAK